MTLEAAIELVDELDAMDESVTTWEAGFLAVLAVQLDQGRHPTQRQAMTLREMEERYLS